MHEWMKRWRSLMSGQLRCVQSIAGCEWTDERAGRGNFKHVAINLISRMIQTLQEWCYCLRSSLDLKVFSLILLHVILSRVRLLVSTHTGEDQACPCNSKSVLHLCTDCIHLIGQANLLEIFVIKANWILKGQCERTLIRAVSAIFVLRVFIFVGSNRAHKTVSKNKDSSPKDQRSDIKNSQRPLKSFFCTFTDVFDLLMSKQMQLSKSSLSRTSRQSL